MLITSFLKSNVSESLGSLTKNEHCERIAQAAHQKWATMSDSLRSLSKNVDHEQIAQVAHQKWANEGIARFFSESPICSLLRKKRGIRSENRWANSQPCWRGDPDTCLPTPSHTVWEKGGRKKVAQYQYRQRGGVGSHTHTHAHTPLTYSTCFWCN